jgi:hypothetical protein
MESGAATARGRARFTLNQVAQGQFGARVTDDPNRLGQDDLGRCSKQEAPTPEMKGDVVVVSRACNLSGGFVLLHPARLASAALSRIHYVSVSRVTLRLCTNSSMPLQPRRRQRCSKRHSTQTAGPTPTESSVGSARCSPPMMLGSVRVWLGCLMTAGSVVVVLSAGGRHTLTSLLGRWSVGS